MAESSPCHGRPGLPQLPAQSLDVVNAVVEQDGVLLHRVLRVVVHKARPVKSCTTLFVHSLFYTLYSSWNVVKINAFKNKYKTHVESINYKANLTQALRAAVR